MGYFEDVYLKRMNLDGETQQERVKTRKEKEFDALFLQKTEYQANILSINEEVSTTILSSLQPNKWNESQVISNLLVSTKSPVFKSGDILEIRQKIKNICYDKKWLILHHLENIAKGYESYKIICLDSEINITDEYGDTQYLIPVKFVNASAALVKDYFSYKDTGYSEPNREMRFITKDFEFLKKGTYFFYKDKGFEFSGIDNISVDGVGYVSIKEHLISPPEPKSSEEILVGDNNNFFLNNR